MPPSVTEAEIQAQIVEGLRALGYEVLVTSARSVRQGYGADHGVPDLLVHGHGLTAWVGLEVKRPGRAVRWSHPEQERLWRSGRTAVVRSFEEACFAVWHLSPSFSKQHPTIMTVGRRFVLDPRKGEVIFDA